MALTRTPVFPALVAAGAEFGEEAGWIVPMQFGPVEEEVRVLRDEIGLVDLGRSGVLTLVGPDARRFSNGMFTNNIRALQPGERNRSAMTDEKGRMQGMLDVWCIEPEHFMVVLDGVTAEAFSDRYGKFIIFDDVELTDCSAERTVLALAGPGAGNVLAAAGLPAPESGCAVAGEFFVAKKERFGSGGYDIVAPVAQAVSLWEALRGAGARVVGFSAQEAARIAAGRVRWPVDMGERALVHEMGLVAECCSFDKGCYIGQEVINRIDVMGQVAKKIWGLTMAEDAIPPLEAEIRVGADVVGVARSGARVGGVSRVLAVLRKPAWQPGLQVEVHAAGRVVGAVVSALPFAP